MKLRTKTYIYLTVTAVGIAANFALRFYRHHLYDLNVDYEREPLRQIQNILIGTTEAFIVGGLHSWRGGSFLGRNEALCNVFERLSSADAGCTIAITLISRVSD